MRVHRREIVNIDAVVRLEPWHHGSAQPYVPAGVPSHAGGCRGNGKAAPQGGSSADLPRHRDAAPIEVMSKRPGVAHKRESAVIVPMPAGGA